MRFVFLFLAFLFSISTFAQKREDRPTPVLMDSSQWLDFTNDTIWHYNITTSKWNYELHRPERIRILKYQSMESIIHVLHTQYNKEILKITKSGLYHYRDRKKYTHIVQNTLILMNRCVVMSIQL